VSISIARSQSSRFPELRWAPVIGHVLVPLIAIAIWAASIRQIDIRSMNNFGLISVLPATFFAAVILLTVSFCIALLRRPVSVPLILVHVGLLILMLYGTPALVEDAPRLSWTYVRLGITDYVMQNESVNPNLNAYFNWPGFFVLAAFIAEVAGIKSWIQLANWAPTFFNLSYLLPLVVIFRSATRDNRVIWLGVWLFYLTNWIDQDYFSPQALAYFLYLALIAVIVTWFRTGDWLPAIVRSLLDRSVAAVPRSAGFVDRLTAPNDAGAPSQPWQKIGLIVAAAAIFLAMTPSHQLTPIAAIVTVAALTILNKITTRGLIIIMGVSLGTWCLYMATPYFQGHLDNHLSQLGQAGGSVSRGVIGRSQLGGEEHLFVVRIRIAVTILLGTLALAGGIRMLWRRNFDQTLAIVGLAPWLVPVVQTYGGEAFLRAYFIALPGMVFFAAAFFFPSLSVRSSWRTVAAMTLVCTVLFSGFLFARYGDERARAYTGDEVEAARYLYETAHPDAMMFAPNVAGVPWRFQDYTLHQFRSLDREAVVEANVEAIVRELWPARNEGAYVVINRSQMEHAIGASPEAAAQIGYLEQVLRASPEFDVLYANQDATIFVLSASAQVEDPTGGIDHYAYH
jgi:hypothetical protein